MVEGMGGRSLRRTTKLEAGGARHRLQTMGAPPPPTFIDNALSMPMAILSVPPPGMDWWRVQLQEVFPFIFL